MSPLMCHQDRFQGESFVTHSARIGLLTRVASSMFAQVTFEGEALPADRTGIRLLTRVNSAVFDDVAL